MPAAAARRRWSRFLAESSLIRHYLWKYRKLVGIGLLALVLVDLLEVIPPLLFMKAVDAAVAGGEGGTLARLALAYVAVAALQALCRYGWRMYLIRASMLSGRDLRDRFAGHLFGLGASFFDKRRVGELMSLATSDVDAIRMAIGAGLLTFADALFYFVTVPVAMYWLSPQLTLLAFLPLPLIPWLVARNEREIHARFQQVQESFARLSAMSSEAINGVRVIKAFAREDAQVRRFRDAGREHIRLSLRLARVQTAFGPTLDFTMSLGLVALLYFGGQGVLDGAVTLGTFVAFQRYIQKMVWPMAALGLAFSYYQRAVASSGRLRQVFGQGTDVPEPGVPGPRGGGAEGRIELHDLSFKFPGADRLALSGIRLTVEPGERVAFVGPIGSGKSALLSLVPRLYPVDRGMLRVDGVDVNDWPLAELRRRIGYVSQDVFLFSESVLENVAFGLHEWSLASVEGPARLAGVHDDVLALPAGYGTRLGERGVNLSGGQKQRLTIARALAARPPILVLDDALSAVDVQTEERILRGLRSRPGRNTELISAHRISTIQDADRIVVLEEGKVRQIGAHAELLADRRGPYRRIYERQRLKEDLDSYLERIHE